MFKYSFLLRFITVASVIINIHTLAAQNIPDAGILRKPAIANSIPAAHATGIVNYVRTWEANLPFTDTAVVSSPVRTVQEVTQSTQYFDDLGRLLQTVVKASSSSGRDIVSPVVYDKLGREPYKYLPYVPQTNAANDGKFKRNPFADQQAFYQNQSLNPGMAGEAIFYEQVDFDTSPLSRVNYSYAAGNSWSKTGGNHPVGQQYLSNTIADGVRIWKMSGDLPVTAAIYNAGELAVSIIAGEGKEQTAVYKDKEGKVILKKVQLADNVMPGHAGWLCTYYVYDDIGNLRFVIPPLAVEKISSSWDVTPVANELCFWYSYDEKNRIITRKVPGADPVEMVYDTRDRLVFTRDGNLKSPGNNQWQVTFYDGLNRPVETALYHASVSREVLQASMNNAPANGNISYRFPGVTDLVVAVNDRSSYVASSSVTVENGFFTREDEQIDIYIDPNLTEGTVDLAVTNPLPGIGSQELTPLTYTFYNDYNYAGAHPVLTGDFNKPLAGDNTYAEPVTAISNRTLGLVTGTKVRVLGTDEWLTTTIYYNDKGRVIQQISDLPAGSKETITTLYDFKGKILSTYLRHTNPASGATPHTTLLTMMSYDGAGRLTAIRKKLNDDSRLERTIAANEYDELGRLKTKQLGITAGGDPLERLTYEYNIRGWLKSIGKEYLNGNSNNAHFAEELSYDDGFRDTLFNGNIAGIKWKGWNDPQPRAYGYNYDKVQRLKQADFTQQSGGSGPWAQDKMDFSVPWITYDANGNIKSMSQKGMNGPDRVLLDQLAYRYLDNSNKLAAVYDTSSIATALGDFKNGSNSTDDYTYDANGNLTQDLNKSITNISYNHLNLPVQITITGKGVITYQYDATGNKLKKVVTDNTVVPAKSTTTSYMNGWIYENNMLQSITHEEGRIRLVNNVEQAPAFVYDYFVKDHLGNTRLVLTEKHDVAVYAATMETPAGTKESALFSNIDNTRVPVPAGYPADGGSTPNRSVAKLNANAGNSKIGPSIVLRVMAGDTIQLATNAFYKSAGPRNNSSAAAPAEHMLKALTQTFNSANSALSTHGASVDDNRTPFATNFDASDYNRLKEKDPDQNRLDKPKAYLNFVLFDDQFKLVEENSGVKQVKAEPDQLQVLVQDKITIKKSGFLYVYTSNETASDVYFDNIVVRKADGPVVEETHYYPFGLTMAGISSNALKGSNYSKNRKEFNGIEHTTDLDLNQYDAFYRNLDPQIGRWYQIDPKVTEYQSPYAIMNNNPVRYADFLGDTINDRQIRTDKTWGKAYQTWSQSKAGKEFIRLFGTGGKLGHINITFKVEDTNGRSGNTTVFKVNKKDGAETKLETNQVYKGVGSIAFGTSKTDYLKFMIKFDANETDVGLENAETILHETQHVRIDQQTLVSNEAMAPASMQHADWMKPASTQWYKERYNFYQENRTIWNPDYERQKAAGKVKSEQDYINRKINDFIN